MCDRAKRGRYTKLLISENRAKPLASEHFINPTHAAEVCSKVCDDYGRLSYFRVWVSGAG